MDVNAKIIPFPLSPARAAELLHGASKDVQNIAPGRQESAILRHFKSHRERHSLLRWARQSKGTRTAAG